MRSIERRAQKSAKDADEFWKKAREQGGWWSAEETATPISAEKAGGTPVKVSSPEFDRRRK